MNWTRAITLLGVFGFCLCAWMLVFLGGIYWAARGLRWIAEADAGGVIAAALVLGGLAAILIGGWLRYAAHASLDEPHRFAVSRAARLVVAIGALVTFGGAGAVLAVGL